MSITTDSSLWNRECPKCSIAIKYMSYEAWYRGNQSKSKCKLCAALYENGLGSSESIRQKNEKSKAPKSIKTPAIADIYWAAGFIEGEGSFNGGTGSMIEITQKNLEPLKKMQDLFGGTISDYTKKRTDKITGTALRDDGYYRWRIYGARARGLELTIYPLLSKRRQNQIVSYMKYIKKDSK